MRGTELDIPSLAFKLSGRVIGRRLLHYELLGSTMDEARGLAGRGEPEGAVVIAEAQSAGRGRFDRVWVSPRGENLSFSVLLRPTSAQLPYMNMAATLAVARMVARMTGVEALVKWPNDVRVGGRKISGILIETAMEMGEVKYAIVGVGVNVNFDPSRFPEIADTATSIHRETGRKADRTCVLTLLLEQFDDLYRKVKSGSSLTSEWAAALETLGRNVQLSWEDKVVEGLAESVDDRGNLVLRRADGSTFTVVAGEVTSQV